MLKGALHSLGAPGTTKRLGFSSVAFSKDGTAYTGASDGCIYKWKGTGLVGKPQQLHTKMISTLNIVDVDGQERLITGCSDQTVNVHSINGGSEVKLYVFKVDSYARSLDMMNGKVLIGLNNGTIREQTIVGNTG